MHEMTATRSHPDPTLDDGRRDAPAAARRVLLLGTHGQANIGDELLLHTFLDQFGTEHHYTVNSYDPDATRRALEDRYDVDVIDTATTRAGLLGHIRDADVVVFGGGSVVKELYASVGRWRYATLAMVLAVVLAARAMRRPVMFAGVGVGPITSRFGRLLARLILRSASLVSVRDEGSLAACRRLGLGDDRVTLIPDVVFVNGPGRFVASTESPTPTDGRLRIALNLNRDIANGDRWSEVLAELADTLDLVARRRSIEVHALPMQSAFKDDDDLSVLRRFLAHRPGWHPVVHEPLDEIDIGRIVADCDVVVSERFHALVIAAVLGRPSVGLIYDVKVAELVEQLALVDRAVDINEPVDPARLADMILRTAEDPQVEGDRLASVAASRRDRLDRHFDAVRSWLADPSNRRWPTDAAG